MAPGDANRAERARILVGTCSWTDRTLTDETDWYPRRTMPAAERLAFYAARFPLVEVDSTYYGPPREEQVRLWAERTPAGFRFDVKAYGLLTGHPTRPASLWRDLRETLPKEVAAKRSINARHLAPEVLDEAWVRFGRALEPLREAGKLGGVLFQYPPWFVPRKESRAELRALRERLPADRVCVELRSPRLLAATPDELAVVRFHGRDGDAWSNTSGAASDRFRYRYSEEELAELAEVAAGLAAQVSETHLLMNNCYRDHAVRNAARLRELVEGLPAPA